MAWFGESLANLKSQVSSFTKEVLTEGREEDEEFAESDELRSAKKLIEELEKLCTEQKTEVEQIKTQALEWQEKSEAQERQSRSSVESYEKLLISKEEENLRLRQQVDSLLLKQKELLLETRKKSDEEGPAHVPPPTASTTVSTSTEDEDAIIIIKPQLHDSTTETEPYEEVELLDDKLELEERCASYQSDLFQLREELMTLQHAVDEKEVGNAKLNEEILTFLHSDFLIDGQAALTGRVKTHPFAAENVVLAALKQLSYVWKDLVDRKGTLERTVAKLSVSDKGGGGQVIEEGRKPFLPPAVDSFGLETIIEDERGEEDNRSEPPLLDDQPASIAFCQPQPSQVQIQRRSLNAPLVSSSTQTVGWDVQELAKERGELLAKLEGRDDRIKKLEMELERLKAHLMEFEEQATSDALVSEERENALKAQLAQVQAQIVQTLKQNDRMVDFKEELNRLTTERDAARSQNATYEEQIQKLGIQLQNLHFVLEQFQKEKETEISNIDKMLRREINQLTVEKQGLEKEVQSKEELLERARSGLNAAQQLSAQIEDKARVITTLKTEVQCKEAEIEKLNVRIKEVGSNLDGKIDRYLIKNLIVGYFSTPVDKRKEVLRVIATVLDFNREDRQKTGLEGASMWPFRSENVAEKPSLSEAFIRFLETESQPKVQVRMPTEEITRRSSRTSSSSTVPGESPTSSPAAPSTSSSAAAATSGPTSAPSPAVVGVPEISMSLPVLMSQADRSNSILKDVLNPKP